MNHATTPKIPIKNIYYMLCYAWNLLEQKDAIELGNEEFDNIYNLLARVYVKGVSGLIKRGLNRNYISKNENLSLLKGKILINESINKQTQIKGRLTCSYDEFSEDFTLNRIIKSTMEVLVKVHNIDPEIRKKLFSLMPYFNEINNIRFSKRLFSNLRYNRNNHHYKMLINISELVYLGLITNEDSKEVEFSDFVRDGQMAKLYEKFILNFYKNHLNSTRFVVHAPKLNWNLNGTISDDDLKLLPEMRTDIVVEDLLHNKQYIIDTKYYAQTLVSSNWSELKKVRTAHLYQIYAYVNQSGFDGDVVGMLLYPTVTADVDALFPMNKEIRIKTLNLDSQWESICERLLSLLN